MHFLVDGMNVIGTRPDGWWRDRPGARQALVVRLSALADSGETVTVVFDGRAPAREVERAATTGVTVVYAPGGRDAADDVIVDLVPGLLESETHEMSEALTVVSSDRGLSQRVRRLGVSVEGAKDFLRRLDDAGC